MLQWAHSRRDFFCRRDCFCCRDFFSRRDLAAKKGCRLKAVSLFDDKWLWIVIPRNLLIRNPGSGSRISKHGNRDPQSQGDRFCTQFHHTDFLKFRLNHKKTTKFRKFHQNSPHAEVRNGLKWSTGT